MDLFEAAWAIYPRRSGSNPKREAQRAWHARRMEKVEGETMLAGVERYLVWCQGTGKIRTEFVLRGSTFFGPGRPFEETWDLPAPPPVKKSMLQQAVEAMAKAKNLKIGGGNVD